MAKISGIYVEIRGDSTQLKKDLATARQHVTEQATGMSNALNNALSPAQLKNNINGIVRNLNTLSQASKLTGKEFGAIGADLKDLQRLTGISEKAFRDLQSRMLQTSAAKAQEKALQSIAKAAGLSAKEVSQLGKQMGVSASSIAAVNGAAKSSASAMSMLGGAARAALAYFSVYTVVEFGRAIMDAGLAMDSLQRSFVAVTGSQAGAAETLSFLREESERLGQNFYVLAPEFKNVMAAARGTAMEGENVRKMFSAIAGASTALGLSADDTHGTLRALQQMMSKGTIQAEELRGQLGERLPGALNLMAKAMGVSTAELNKMMADGKLLADDALPKLTIAIEEMYGAAAEKAALESGRAAVNLLSQAWTDFKVNLFDNEQAVAGINAITSAIKTLTEYAGLRSVSNTFAQGAGLAAKGLIDFDVFKAAGYLERQRMVDEFIDSQKVAAKNFTATWAAAEQQNLESFERYNERRQELEAAATKKREDAAKKANEELRKLTQTDMEKLAERRDKLIADGADRVATEKWYAGEVAKLNEKSTKKFLDEQNKQLEAHKKAREAMRKNEAETLSAIDKWMDDYEQRQIDAVANGVAERKKLREDEAKAAADAARKIAEEQEASAQKVMDRIQEGTADVFYDMFQDIGKGWETLWTSMKNWALRTLAELAARAAMVNIVVPIMTVMTGTTNATQAVQAITGGQGGFSPSILSSLVQPGSMLSKIPGMNAVTGLLGATLPGTATALTGAFSSVGAGAGMYATGLGFGSGAVASGALQGMTLGGQSLATAAPAMTSGLTLGSALGMGALGGLGYSLLGSQIGLPQNQWSGITSSLGGALGAWGGSALASSAAGAALGATAGSVVPIIGTALGAIGGGLLSSLFGGGKEHSPSIIFQKQNIAWGQTDAYKFHTKSGAKTSQGTQIARALGQVAGTTFDQVESLLNAIGSGYVDQLKDATVTWGRKAGGLWGAWDFGADHNFEELFAKASEDLKRRIYEAAAPVLSKAGSDYLGSSAVTDAYALMADGAAQFDAITKIIRQGVQNGDLETYATQLQSFQLAIATVSQTWDAVSQASAELVKPLTQYEQAQRAINQQYDVWTAQLEALGFAAEKVAKIDADRAEVLANLAAENKKAIDSVLRDSAQTAVPLSEFAAAQQRINAQFDDLASQLRNLGAAAEYAAQVEAGRQAALAAAAAQQSRTIQYAQAELSGTVDQFNIKQIADRYKWDETYIKDGKINRANVQRDVIDWFKGASVKNVQDAAAGHKTTESQIIDDVKYLEEYLKKLDSAVDKTTAKFRDLAAALAKYRQSLIVGQDSALPLSARLAAAQAEYDRVSRLALAGDQDAAGNLSSVANKWLELSKESAKTQEDYGRTFGDVLRRVDLIVGKLSGKNVPGFAAGGFFSGGLRIVGENGPEMEATGPSRIWSASETRALLSGGDSGASVEIRSLREEVRAIGSALARNTMDMAKMLRRWDGNGMPEVRA